MIPEIPVGAALWIAAAWLTFAAAGRWSARWLPVERSPTERLMRTLLLATLFMIWPVALLGMAGWLDVRGLAVIALGLYLTALRLPAPPLAHSANSSRLDRWTLAATALLVGLDLATFLPIPPIDWDAVTYHLYLPARWLQEGRLFHVPTVFSDNAAAFAPQNGALFFTWQMALSGRDALINISQLLCLVFMGLALYRTSRLLGLGRQPATLAALTLPWLAPIRRWTYSGNVDIFMVAFAFGALYWQVLYLRRAERPTLVACGLATGLAAGTKVLGLPLTALQALPLLLVLIWRKRVAELCMFFACVIAGGGWWYLKNAWLYGNPLFPVRISLPFFELPGAYGPEALRAGEFHLVSWRAVALSLRDQYGATTCLLMGLGLVVLARRARRGLMGRRYRDRYSALLLFAFAITWAGFFTTVIPHNDQARFALPVLVISLIGWGLLLRRARHSGVGPMAGLWLAGVSAAVFASRPWAAWSFGFATLARAEIDIGRWLGVAGLGGAVLLGVWSLRSRIPRPAALAATAVVLWLAVTTATSHSDTSRAAFFAQADYRDWGKGFLRFNHPEATPARIAYSGANVPYALVGAGWRHRVIYLNTQGAADDGFYDFWNRDRRTYPHHKPGLYRGDDDEDLWLARLAEENIDTVVLFALHRAEGRYIRATPEGFPIERAWVQSRPELFEPILTERRAEIYRLRPE